MLLETQSTV